MTTDDAIGVPRRARPEISVRYDLRARPGGPGHAELFATMLEQAAYAEQAGLESIHLSEHHHAEDGYLSSVFPAAAAIAARTSTITIRPSALILPLHDPVRVAEDAAMVDVISGGRLELTVAVGYREIEYAMFGKGFADRGIRLRRDIELLRRAWTGEQFTVDGRSVLVRPTPVRPGGPPLIMGGSTPRTARRAAEIADGYDPAVADLRQVYLDACAELGRDPGRCPPRVGPFYVFVSDDPERDRNRIAPYVHHEMQQYAKWEAQTTYLGDDPDIPLDAVWATNSYHVLTPDETVELIRGLDPDGMLNLHPLVGGLDPAIANEGLQRFVEQVLPRLDASEPAAVAPVADRVGAGAARSTE